MSGWGIASPYLWAWKKFEKRAIELSIEFDYMKELSSYERRVCIGNNCGELPCEMPMLEDCYKKYMEGDLDADAL